jgi:hypothetical protein
LALLPSFLLSARRPWAARDFFNEQETGRLRVVMDGIWLDI